MKFSPAVKIVWEFIEHILILALSFVVIMLVALGLNLFARWLESWNVLPELMIKTVYALEWFIFAFDVLLFVIVMIIFAIDLVNDLIKLNR